MIGSSKAARFRGVRALHALVLLFAVILNLLLLLGLALSLFDDDDYRQALIWSADYFLDSRLEIGGAFSLSIGREVRLRAENVRLSANDDSYDLSLGQLDMEQRLGSYIATGKLWFNHLHARDLSGEIRETRKQDEFDWEDYSLPALVIEELQLRELSLAYTELDQQRHSLELDYILVDDSENRGPVKLSAAGEINARALRLDGTLGSLAQLRSDNQTYPIDFILSSADSGSEPDKPVIDFSGTVGHTHTGRRQVDAVFDIAIPELVPIFDPEIVADNLGQIQGSFIAVQEGGDWRIRQTRFVATGTDAYRLSVDGTVDNTGQFTLRNEFWVVDPRAFAARFGFDLGGYPPFKSKGLISGENDRLSYRGNLSLGRTDGFIALNATLGRHKPQIEVRLNANEVYLADIGINQHLSLPADSGAKATLDPATRTTSGTNAPDDTSEGRAGLDRESFDFSGLRHFDLELEVLVNEIIGADFSIDRLAGQARLANGALRVSPMRISLEGGDVDLELALDTRDTPTASLEVVADDLLLDGVVPHEQGEMQATGKARLHMDLDSRGSSVHAMISALSGKIDLELDEVGLPARYLEYFSLDDVGSGFEIDGALALYFDQQVGFSAEALRVTGDDGRYDISLGKLAMQPSLVSYFETGTWWIHDLTVTDLHADIVASEPEQEHDPRWTDWHEFDLRVSHLPIVFIEKMQLDNLSLNYTGDDRQDRFTISSLVLANDDTREPMRISAAGTANALTLELEGLAGTSAQPRGQNRVYPVDLTLRSTSVDATPDRQLIRIHGDIDSSVPGRNLLQASFDVDVNQLVAIFNQQSAASELGHLRGSVTVADVDNHWGIRKIKLDATDTELYRLKIEGEIDEANRLELYSEAEVPDPATLGALFGVDLEGYGAYLGKGVVSATSDKISFRGLASIGSTESDTTLDITLVDGKPLVRGKLLIPDLYLPDIGLDHYIGLDPNVQRVANPHAGEQQTPAESVPPATETLQVFDREPLDFSGLHYFNLDLEILIDEITGVDFSIEKLEGHIGLTDGLLRLSPMRLTFEGGLTEIELELNARNKPAVSLNLTGDDLLLEEVIASVQEEVPVKGKVHLKVELASSGVSEHEMASNLSGKLSFALERARVPKRYVEFLTADLFGFMFRSVTFEDSYATLNCVLTGVEVDQGVAKTVLLFGDGPRLAVDGAATVDLGQETIDMVLLPNAKKRIKLEYSRITVKGPLANPNVETSGTAAAAAATVGSFILVPEVIVPLFLVEQVWRFFSSDDDSGCNDYIEEHQVDIERHKAR